MDKEADPLLNPQPFYGQNTKVKKRQRSDIGVSDLGNHQLSTLKPSTFGRRVRRRRCDCLCLCSWIYRIISFGGGLALLGFMLYFYYKYQDYECEENLQLWLFVNGVGGLSITFILTITHLLYNYGGAWCEECCEECRFSVIAGACSVILVVSWEILGSVWLYRIDTETPDGMLCDKTLYDFCWYTLTVWWGLLALLLCVMCLALCVLGIQAAR